MIRLILIFAAVLAIAASELGKLPVKLQDNTQHIGILRGKNASISDHPYMAACLHWNYILGSAVILNRNWVVTVGYNAYSPDTIQLRVGSSRWEDGGQTVNVSSVILHPNYTGSWVNDIALLKLSTPLVFGRNVKSIKLGTEDLQRNTQAVVTGWGQPTMRKSYSSQLNYITTKVLDRKKCARLYGTDPTLFCTKTQFGGPCAFDFGDPLVVDNKLYGLFAGGDSCISEPRVYVNIPALVDWIHQTMST